jgi:hypothetical protein
MAWEWRFVDRDRVMHELLTSQRAQYFYTTVQRGARKLLEERGALPPREKHKNGAEWLFWAEESNSSATR